MSIAKKINFEFIKRIERSIFMWAQVRRYRITLFIFVVLLLILLSRAPYTNLFFNSYFVILVGAVLAPFILDIDARPFLVTSMILFVLMFIVWFFDRDNAEAIANYIFILLLSWILRTLFSFEKASSSEVSEDDR